MRRALKSAAVVVLVAACVAPQADAPTAPGSDLARGGGIKAVTVSPSSASRQVGQTVQLTASTKPPSSGTVFTWSSANAGVATVSGSGLVTAVSPGTATIGATAGGKTGNATITVTTVPPPPPPPPPPLPPGSVTFVGTGDIASCGSSGDEATANLLDGIPGSVFTLGDNVYNIGSTAEYNNCYNPSWGRHKARTHPSPGNHEYGTAGAAGYFAYFGAAAGDPTKGYYSFNLGAWHVVVLNSNIARDANSSQVQWLRADLTSNTKACTIAYWHHPRWSSGFEHGNNTSVQAFWDVLYEFNADLILGGHDHDYERFAPQTPAGVANLATGIRQFVVGTGGRSLYALGTLKANSQVFFNATNGVLKLTLSEGGYGWQYIPTSGSFSDTGNGVCH